MYVSIVYTYNIVVHVVLIPGSRSESGQFGPMQNPGCLSHIQYLGAISLIKTLLGDQGTKELLIRPPHGYSRKPTLLYIAYYITFLL